MPNQTNDSSGGDAMTLAAEVPQATDEPKAVQETNQVDSVATDPTTPTGKNRETAIESSSSSHHNPPQPNGATTKLTPLPSNFAIGPNDVWCGRGKTCYAYCGNVAYRERVMEQIPAYTEARTKLQKGLILRNVMDSVRAKSREWHVEQGHGSVGGFVKKGSDGVWYDVGDFVAKEKTGQLFRDALAPKYSSSAQSKYLKRQRTRELEKSTNLPKSEISDIVNAETKKLRRSSTSTVVDAPGQEQKLSLDGNAPNNNSAPACVDQPYEKSSSPNGLQGDGSQHLASVNPSSTSLDSTGAPPNVGIEAAPTTSSPAETMPTILATKAAMPTALDPPNEVRVCALQSALRGPDESPIEAARRVQAQMGAIASREMVDMFLLPELCPIGYSEDTFSKYLPFDESRQAMYKEIDLIMEQTANQLRVYVSYGTIGWTEEGSDGSDVKLRFHIRQKVLDRQGAGVAVYDKTHLCDYGACNETRFFQPGPASRPVSFKVDSSVGDSSFRFGTLICADMRYPNLSRSLAGDEEHLVDCILQPAAFLRDASFRTWSSFRETRAVENSVFWIAVNYAGSSYGGSSIVPPWVDEEHEPVTLAHDEGYLMGFVSRKSLNIARNTMPFYRALRAQHSKKS